MKMGLGENKIQQQTAHYTVHSVHSLSVNSTLPDFDKQQNYTMPE